MATLTEQEVYELAVYLIEITDAVIGGANGIANLQAKQLANRTAWLKANKQDKDATLTALAALVGSANKVPYFTAEDVLTLMTVSPFARTLLDDADAATMRATLDIFNKSEVGSAISTAVSALVASSPAALDTLNELAAALGNDANFATNITNALANKQDKDATLTAIATLTTAADKLIYATGADMFSTTTLTAFARTLLDDADAATMRATLGVLNPEKRQLASAWVKFDGISTPPNIIASFNISSVVRLSTGVFRLYFSAPMNNTNIVAAGMIRDLDTSASNHNVTGHDSAWTTTYIDVRTEYGTGTVMNFSDVGVIVFGGLN